MNEVLAGASLVATVARSSSTVVEVEKVVESDLVGVDDSAAIAVAEDFDLAESVVVDPVKVTVPFVVFELVVSVLALDVIK